jgi:PAS domain S-box-containing protein
MKKPVFRTALFYALLAGGLFLVDLVIDRWIGGTAVLNLPHIILAVIVVVASFFVLNRAMQERRSAESVLRQARDELAKRVRERTAELEHANETLQAEITERQQAVQERQRSLEQVEQGRRRAENLAGELRLANNMLRTLIETLPIGMVITDPEGEIILANPLAKTIMGSAMAVIQPDFLGDLPLYHPDGSRFIFEDLPLIHVLKQKTPSHAKEAILRREDGSQVFLWMAAGPVCDESGHILSAVKIIQDITEIRRMEQAVRESEERYRVQFDNFSEPTTVWNKDGVLIMQNLVSARNMGGKREDFIGKNMFDLFGENAKGYKERLDRVITSGVTENQEDVNEIITGTHYFWTCMQRNQDTQGNHTVQVISYDITDRKIAERAVRTSEEKFARVFHSSPDAISIIQESNGIFLDINEAFTRMMGYSRDEVIGKTWQELGLVTSPDEQEKLARLFLEKKRVENYELNFTTHQGNTTTMLLSLTSITVSGEPCILGISHDITERKLSEESLQRVEAELAVGVLERATLKERQRLARELHDSVSQALYGISLGAHTAVSLFDTDREKVLEALNYVISLTHAGITEMRALIFELRPESLETEGLVVALTKQVEALRARHGIQVELKLSAEPDVPFLVKEVLYRIAQEALQNAIKHARPSRLDLLLEQLPDCLTLKVRDNGLGFNTQLNYPGHLGLRSMHERALSVGGTLNITSEIDYGTQVVAQIPIS